jgi:hypothetical protein
VIIHKPLSFRQPEPKLASFRTGLEIFSHKKAIYVPKAWLGLKKAGLMASWVLNPLFLSRFGNFMGHRAAVRTKTPALSPTSRHCPVWQCSFAITSFC